MASNTQTDESQEGDGILLDEESLLRAPQPVKGFTPAKVAGGFHARHLAGFWIGGLINNFSYVVFLTAAEDILTGYSGAVSEAGILMRRGNGASSKRLSHRLCRDVRCILVSFLKVVMRQSDSIRATSRPRLHMSAVPVVHVELMSAAGV